jgi:hypothetical protein
VLVNVVALELVEMKIQAARANTEVLLQALTRTISLLVIALLLNVDTVNHSSSFSSPTSTILGVVKNQ